MLPAGPKVSAKAAELQKQLIEAIGSFIVEFTALEALYWGALLRQLAIDWKSIQSVEDLVELADHPRAVRSLAEQRSATATATATAPGYLTIDDIEEHLDLEQRLQLIKALEQQCGISDMPAAGLSKARGRMRDLMRHRNVIVHCAAAVNVTGATEENVEAMFAGVRLPKSKRQMPSKLPPPEKLQDLVRSWSCTVEEIEAHTREARDLQGFVQDLTRQVIQLRTGISP